MEDRAKDWLAQAKNDLKWASVSLNNGFFAQVCFIAQQTAEKALKALAYQRGFDLVKSHSVRIIAGELGFNDDIARAAKVLDQYYIGARYPDSLPAGAPFEVFVKDQAKEAMRLARLVVRRVEKKFAAKGK